MLSVYRRRGTRALTKFIRRGTISSRLARSAYNAAKKLAPLAREAGAKSSIQRKLGPPKVIEVNRRSQRAMKSAGISADYDAPGNDYSKVSFKLGRKKAPTVGRLDRLFHKVMRNVQFRFQNMSQFDTNVGALPLAQRQIGATPTDVFVPLHIYDLTTCNNVGVTLPAGKQFGWTGSSSSASVQRVDLPGQDPTGLTQPVGYYNTVEAPGQFPINAKCMLHNWSDIRMLLYSARKRTTTFKITFFRCKDNAANPFFAASTNTDLKQLIEWFTRGQIYNTIQTYNTEIAKKIKIVKQYTIRIPGSQSTDVDTTVGKTKEVRIFMRHGTTYKMDWMDSTEASLAHNVADGLDYTLDDAMQNHPWHSSRLFMAITALSPERRTVTSTFDTALADSEPSYDILIRNSMTFP